VSAAEEGSIIGIRLIDERTRGPAGPQPVVAGHSWGTTPVPVWDQDRWRQDCDGSRPQKADRLLIGPTSGRQAGTGLFARTDPYEDTRKRSHRTKAVTNKEHQHHPVQSPRRDADTLNPSRVPSGPHRMTGRGDRRSARSRVQRNALSRRVRPRWQQSGLQRRRRPGCKRAPKLQRL
jgi:hypothetical protein